MKLLGKISAQSHTTLCIQFLDRENNDKNNTLPLGKQICFTIVWGCVEILSIIVLIPVVSSSKKQARFLTSLLKHKLL